MFNFRSKCKLCVAMSIVRKQFILPFPWIIKWVSINSQFIIDGFIEIYRTNCCFPSARFSSFIIIDSVSKINERNSNNFRNPADRSMQIPTRIEIDSDGYRKVELFFGKR
jgi:hypothetical protein